MCLRYMGRAITDRSPDTIIAYKIYCLSGGLLRSPYHPDRRGGYISNSGTFLAEVDPEHITNEYEVGSDIYISGFHLLAKKSHARKLRDLLSFDAFAKEYYIEYVVVKILVNKKDIFATGLTPVYIDGYGDCYFDTYVASSMTVTAKDFRKATDKSTFYQKIKNLFIRK